VIDRTDARPIADATSLRCVTAKPLIPWANDATDATDARVPPDFPRPLREAGRRDRGVEMEGNLVLRACDLIGAVVFNRATLKGKIPRCARDDSLLRDDSFIVIPSAARDLSFTHSVDQRGRSITSQALRVRSLCISTPMGRRAAATERTSDGCDRKTSGATAPGVQNGFLRSRQPLDSKGCDRKRPHRPQEKTIDSFFGPARRSSVRDAASAPCPGRSEPRALVPARRPCDHPKALPSWPAAVGPHHEDEDWLGLRPTFAPLSVSVQFQFSSKGIA